MTARRPDAPEILGRLRTDAEARLSEPAAPGWAKWAGRAIVAAIALLVIALAVGASPL